MTAAKGQILPFFIPHLGCPCRCVFCDQHTISGQRQAPSPAAVLDSIKKLTTPAELAFFGGSFTALPVGIQEAYLSVAKKAKAENLISGIRISTRPDCLAEEQIQRLLFYGVNTVEIGVQSMSDSVLALSKRGHTAADSIRALKAIKAAGFVTGVQLMPGLPGADFAADFFGAEKILKLSPDYLRIYPTLVLANTELATMYQQKHYQALTMEAALQRSAAVAALAELYGTRLIRIGINPSGELAAQVIAGPYHPAFGHMVKSVLWREQLLMLLQKQAANISHFQEFVVHKSDLSAAFGQNACNKSVLTEALSGRRLKISGRGTTPGLAVALYDDGHRESLSRTNFINIYIEQIQKQFTTSC